VFEDVVKFRDAKEFIEFVSQYLEERSLEGREKPIGLFFRNGKNLDSSF